VRPDYILGPNDQILIRSNAEEISDRPYRVDQDGYINLPLVNRVPVSGITVAALERDLIARLRMFLVAPEVSITVTGFRNEPVSFFGAFVRPGIYPLTGGRTLVEMLTVAGGLQPNASRHLRITRRADNGPIPLPSAIVDPASGASSVQVDITNLAQELNPAEDIELKAGDRVIAEQAQPIYVGGEVAKSVPIELGNRDSFTVMQALSQSGFTATAKRKKVIVLRPVEGTGKLARIDVDLRRIINGIDNDFPLYPNDILYVDRQSQFMTVLPNAALGLFTSVPYALIYAALR
jgi:polysaccharide export outer membrane protein